MISKTLRIRAIDPQNSCQKNGILHPSRQRDDSPPPGFHFQTIWSCMFDTTGAAASCRGGSCLAGAANGRHATRGRDGQGRRGMRVHRNEPPYYEAGLTRVKQFRAGMNFSRKPPRTASRRRRTALVTRRCANGGRQGGPGGRVISMSAGGGAAGFVGAAAAGSNRGVSVPVRSSRSPVSTT